MRASNKADEDSADCLQCRTARAGGLATQRRRRFKISESSLGFPLTALRREDEDAKREEIPRNQAAAENRVAGGSLAGRGQQEEQRGHRFGTLRVGKTGT